MPMQTNKNTGKSPESRNIKSGLIIVLSWLLFFNVLLWGTTSYNDRQQPYSQFIEQVEKGQVSKARIGSDRIYYALKSQPNKEFITIPLQRDAELPALLRQQDIEYSAIPSSDWIGGFLNWIFIIFLIWIVAGWFLSRSNEGGGAVFSIGKSKARIYSQGTTGVTFEDVAGVEEAKTELKEIVDFLQNTSKYTRLGAKIPKGILLVGPPGTGKTLLARAIAGEAGVPFFSISASEFIELFVGIGASRVRDLFENAKQQAPCIVFIDELDALGKSRVNIGNMTGSNDEREQTLNQLLAEMDGFDPNTGVILLAATNRPEVLDPALLRPGRFDRQVLVDRPDKIGRLAILEVHARKIRLSEEVDLEKIAARTPGFAGADLANLVNEAALLAARNDRDLVTSVDFNEAIERLLTGLEKKSRVLNELEKKTVAYHEVGHAIVGAMMPGAGKVEKISIVPRGMGALGYTLQLPEEDRFLMLENEIRGRIATLLGGRAAEELIFGIVSTGASDDIQKATDLADRFVTMYGMSDKLGAIAFEKIQSQFLPGATNLRRQVSPKVAEEIDSEVKAIVAGAHFLAARILEENRPLLVETADILLEQETIEGKQLKQLLDRVQMPSETDRWLRGGKTSIDDLKQLPLEIVTWKS
ncbi:MAG: ATP-dependent zinc metalloprotease FtsH [Prochloraceae cyanobacterium]|nr:ATP-dependent zinc metalloprotease FtsH [Prochloraceae cyanobacterium]